MPKLLSLPEEILIDIASWIDDEQDVCSLELTSKGLYDFLSNCTRIGPCKRRLDLRTCFSSPSPEASRWLQKRARWYGNIISDFSAAVMLGTTGLKQGPANGTVPPLLPSLLAACAPSARLTLYVEPDQGERFFGMLFHDIMLIHDAGRETAGFWVDMRQRLTKLTIATNHGTDDAQDLETISMLTALQELVICDSRKPYFSQAFGQNLFRDLSGNTVALNLPDLVSLRLSDLEEGTFVLSCPKLAEAHLVNTKALCMNVQSSALGSLMLADCSSVQVEIDSCEDQLQNLKTVCATKCTEVGRHLFEDVHHMKHLEQLEFGDFPAACMPESFPQSLRELYLYPSDWQQDLPGGLKELFALEVFCFKPVCMTWTITRPLAEFLPIKEYKYVALGSHVFSPEKIKHWLNVVW